MRASEEAADGRPFVGFKRHLRAEVVPGEAVYLLSVRGVTALHGRHVESLAPLLDGTRTLEGLLADASSTVPAAEAGRVIGDLARAKVIGYHSSGAAGEADESAAAYWDLAGLDGARAAAAVRSATVRLVTVGRVDAEDARSACHASGLEVTGPCGPAELGPAPAGAGFSLVLCDDYLAPELAEVDAWHRAAGRPWLLARPCGAEPWTGPVFRPDDGPCWSCLAHRLRAHRQSEIPVQRALGADGPVRRPPASVAAGRAMGLHMAVLEAAKWAAGVREASQDSVCTLDTLTMRSGHHTVQRRPQCPECGDARVEQKVDLVLEHLDIRPAGPGLDRVGALLRDGKQVAAVKAYRRITGAGLLEAKEAVDRMAAAGDGRASAGQPAGKPVSPGGSQGR
ncbi:TOMM precursor leader peptide-binding protein [Streptomyces sp. NPDC048845]|uniref:TOMM precursor leader peptide-binding protein n=1 Tax=Streptomyces sp. NPDC048845 TaxID=3155390 RepID=UPI00342DF866